MRKGLAAGLGLLLVMATPRAHAQSACAKAYEEAQYAKKAKRFRDATKHLLVCSQRTCSKAVVADCSTWREEVERATPTIVVAAKDEKGNDLTDVTVSMDGEVLATKLDGSAMSVDYGEHTFRFERGGVTSEQKILVREGEKNRVLEAKLVAPSSPPVEEKPATSHGKGMIPIYVLAAVGGTAVVTGSILGITVLTGRSECQDKKASGTPCSEDEISSLETRRTLTDVFLGVGIVSLGVAGVLYFTRDKMPPPQASRSVAPILSGSSSGGFVGLRGTF